MKRPFGRPLLAYALGVLLAEYVQLPFLWILAGSAVFTVIALLQPNRWAWIILAGLAAAGATNLNLSQAILSPADLRRLIGEDTVLSNVRGKLRTTPEVRASFRKEREEFRYVAYLDATEIRTSESGWKPAVGTILINAPSPISQDVYAGRSVEVMGMLLKPAAAQAEGLFDYRQYLQRQGVYYQLRLSSTNGWVSVS